LKSSLISVNHPSAATSDIPILFAALFIQIVALQGAPRQADAGGNDKHRKHHRFHDRSLGC
jgi:hypothetical protein